MVAVFGRRQFQQRDIQLRDQRADFVLQRVSMAIVRHRHMR